MNRGVKFTKLLNISRKGTFSQKKVLIFLFCLLMLLGIAFSAKVASPAIAAPPAIVETFDSEYPTWEVLQLDPFAKVKSQIRKSEQARSGLAESVTIQSPTDGMVFLGHTIAYPCLIGEMQPTIWVRSENMSVCAALQIVLPQTLNAENGEPITILLPGTSYQRYGEWEQLRFHDLLRRFNQQIPALRLELKTNVNPNGAYVRRIVLCGQFRLGESEIMTDDLEVSGVATLSSDHVAIYERHPDFTPLNMQWFLREQKIFTSDQPTYSRETELTGIDVGDWMRDPSSVEPALGLLKREDRVYVTPVAGESPIRQQSFLAQNDARTITAENSAAIHVPGTLSPNYSATPAAPGQLSELEVARRKALLQPLGQPVQVKGQLLVVDTLPKSIRAIEYQGEPLDFLANLQFNTVWLSTIPSEQFLDEAWQIGLWVVSPRPGINELNAYMQNQGTPNPIAHLFRRDRNPILAWDMGSGYTLVEYEQVVNWAKALRFADTRRCPIICNVESGIGTFSRDIDIMLLRNEPLFSSLDFLDYQEWLKIQSRLGALQKPNWCTIQTQPSPFLENQWKQFGLDDPKSIASVSLEQIRMQLYSGLAADCHGFLFASKTPLNAQDAETEFRVAALELINWEMFLQEGWYSLGKTRSVVGSSDPRMSAVITQAERSQLLLPMVNVPHGQCVMGETVENNVRFIAPGSLETYTSYILIPGGTRPLYPERKAGGIEIVMEEVGLGTPVFFAQSETVLQGVLPRTRQQYLSRRAAELAVQIAELRFQNDKAVMEKFNRLRASTGIPILPTDNQPIIDPTEQTSLLRETERALGTARNLLRQNDFASAFLQAERSVRGLQLYERSTWERAVRNMPNHNMIPTAVTFATLPYYVSTVQRITSTQLGQNRLVAGDCEDLNQWIQAKWSRFEIPSNPPPSQSYAVPMESLYTTSATLSSMAARTGKSGLQIAVTPLPNLDQNTIDGIQIETAPICITTPQIPVYAGELLCIHGYIKIPKKLTGSVDGLIVMDSLGGVPLELRFTETAGDWREFVCYRVVPGNGNMVVTFALCGIGEVWLDDLAICPVVAGPPPQTPSAEPQPSSSPYNWLPNLFPR